MVAAHRKKYISDGQRPSEEVGETGDENLILESLREALWAHEAILRNVQQVLPNAANPFQLLTTSHALKGVVKGLPITRL